MSTDNSKGKLRSTVRAMAPGAVAVLTEETEVVAPDVPDYHRSVSYAVPRTSTAIAPRASSMRTSKSRIESCANRPGAVSVIQTRNAGARDHTPGATALATGPRIDLVTTTAPVTSPKIADNKNLRRKKSATVPGAAAADDENAPASTAILSTIPTTFPKMDPKTKRLGRAASTPRAVAVSASDADDFSDDDEETDVVAPPVVVSMERQMLSPGAPKGRNRFRLSSVTEERNVAAQMGTTSTVGGPIGRVRYQSTRALDLANLSETKSGGSRYNDKSLNTLRELSAPVVSRADSRSSRSTTSSKLSSVRGGDRWASTTAGGAASSTQNTKQRFSSITAAHLGAVAVSTTSISSSAGDVMASKERLASMRKMGNSQRVSNAIAAGVVGGSTSTALTMTTTESPPNPPARGAVSMTDIEGSIMPDKDDVVGDSIKYGELHATDKASVPDEIVPGYHCYDGNQDQPSRNSFTLAVETMHTNSTQGVDTTAAIFDDSNRGVLTHANAPPPAQPATVRDAEFVVVDIVENKGGEKSLCSCNRWLVLGVIVAVIAIGGAVGGVLAGGGGDSSNEENGPAPTIAFTLPPTPPLVSSTVPPTAAPTISSDEVTRWMDVISAASPNTSFLDPAGAASQALEWMKADIFSASLDDPSLVQRFAFVTLWYSTDGANWNVSPNWLDAGGSECDWKGVTCDVNNITAIALLMQDVAISSFNLVGPIPLELGLLTMLEAINFAYNGLTGTIPTELGQLTKIVTFAMLANSLMGTIPTELGLLTATKELYIDENDLQGSIPSEIGQLSLLEVFGARSNQLVGPLLLGGQLSALKIMLLSDNQLSSTLPTELGLLTSMVTLALAQNKFEMGIPSELGQLTKLTNLVLNNANLGLTIPTEIGLLAALNAMNLNSNNLTGPIPSEIGMLTNLYSLEIRTNWLTGSIPETMCPPSGELLKAVIDCAEIECACCETRSGPDCPKR